MKDNPNEYDDLAYTEAANRFQNLVVEAINDLWEAGGQIHDIENEWNNAMANSEAT